MKTQINKKDFRDAENENSYYLELYKNSKTGNLEYRSPNGNIIKVADKNGLETFESTITSLQSTINTLPVAPITTTVNISSAQILNSGSTPITIPEMPNLSSGLEYYDIEKVNWEFTRGLVDYQGSKSLSLIDLDTNNNIDTVPIGMFTSAYNNFYNSPLYTGNVYSLIKKVGFKSLAGAVTTGDGTLRVTITFRVKTFGV